MAGLESAGLRAELYFSWNPRNPACVPPEIASVNVTSRSVRWPRGWQLSGKRRLFHGVTLRFETRRKCAPEIVQTLRPLRLRARFRVLAFGVVERRLAPASHDCAGDRADGRPLTGIAGDRADGRTAGRATRSTANRAALLRRGRCGCGRRQVRRVDAGLIARGLVADGFVVGLLRLALAFIGIDVHPEHRAQGLG